MSDITRDSNGSELHNGDSVHLIKDLKLRGTSKNVKRGTVMKNIKLTSNPGEIECKMGKTIIVLKTEYLKKK